IDKTGQNNIKGAPYLNKHISEEVAVFEVYNSLGGHKWSYIDKKGKIAIEPELEEASEYSDGLARVKQYGKYTFIDKTGRIIVDPVFDSANDFSGGLARVYVGTRWGYIDKQGKYVWRSK